MKGKWFQSLGRQILVMVLLAWLVPTMVLGTYIVATFFPALREKTEAALVVNVDHAYMLVEDSIERLITLAKDVTYDGTLTKTYRYFKKGELKYQDYYTYNRLYLEGKFARQPYLTFALYYSVAEPEQFIHTKMGNDEGLAVARGAVEMLLEMGETLDTVCAFVRWEDQLLLVRNLYDGNLDLFGMLVLGISERELLAPLTNCAAEWGAQIGVLLGDAASGDTVDWDGYAGSTILEEQNSMYLVEKRTTNYNDFFVRLELDKNVLYANMNWFTRLLVVLVVFLVPLCMLVIYYVHRRVVRPIGILHKATLRMEGGELGIDIPMRGQDELGQLGRAFTNMSAQLKVLIDKVYKEEIALRDAKIQAMQSRINPHFLNNALEIINWQARIDGNDGISNMIEALSTLMNASLDRDNQHLVPLEKELEIAAAYFYFIRQRFGDQLSVHEEIDDTLLGFLMPRMMLQTLLENAVEHGLAPAGGGRIDLIVKKVDDQVRIEAINTGKRLTEGDLRRIEAILTSDSAEARSHVGLRNVNDRLQLIYEGKADLYIGTTRQGDTRVCITLPWNGESAQTDTTNHTSG